MFDNFLVNLVWPHHNLIFSLSIGYFDSGLQSGFRHGPVDPILIFLVDLFHSVPVAPSVSLKHYFSRSLKLPHQTEPLSSDFHDYRDYAFPSRIVSLLKLMLSEQTVDAYLWLHVASKTLSVPHLLHRDLFSSDFPLQQCQWGKLRCGIRVYKYVWSKCGNGAVGNSGRSGEYPGITTDQERVINKTNQLDDEDNQFYIQRNLL
ncbi:unnamed protein product [Protopolystoma xenopodis]|uniref:Uncharacterized protein n=1 Tax=Protopolystoma xenopodis TaxID=117903 RepID=A0A3S5C7Y0_9PLAT|nr:unnamed protein product [Protopolystoma xenopodis]